MARVNELCLMGVDGNGNGRGEISGSAAEAQWMSRSLVRIAAFVIPRFYPSQKLKYR